MNAQFAKAANWFNGLITRERWLVLAAAAVLVALLMDALLVAPQGKANAKKQAALETAEKTLASTEQQLTALQGASANNPLTAKTAEQNALQLQVSTLQEELDTLSAGLVKADSLAKLLEDILMQSGKLELQQMTTEPPEAKVGGLNKHPVTIKLTGSFADVVSYLKTLESLDWNFYWQELNYNVQQYPTAEVELKVYTLSTAEEVI